MSRTPHYANLINGQVVPAGDSVAEIVAWAQQFQDPERRRIGLDKIGEAEVSTVFLGINHGFAGPPLWFETMIFGGFEGEYCERYETLEQARAGHARVVAKLAECLAKAGSLPSAEVLYEMLAIDTMN